MLFDILHLLAYLLDLGFEQQHVVRDVDVVGLGSDGIGFAVHLLHSVKKACETATDRDIYLDCAYML